jgi:peptidoglycan/LPS O-acetylase OafA/YrhL
MKGKNIAYIPAVDQLRGVAGLLIIFYHGLHVISYQLRFGRPFAFDNWLPADNILLAALAEGHTAVSLFMVLSGFIFTYGAHAAEVIYGGFVYNRILRIFPLFLFIYISSIYLFPESYSFLGLLQGVLLQSNLPGSAYVEPFTALFWTIAVEFQFYLLFPFLLRFQRHYGRRYLLLVIVLLLTMRLIGLALGANARDFSYATIVGRLDQFILGMLLALLFRAHPRHPLAGPGLLATLAALIGALAWFHWLGGYPAVAWYKIIWPTVEGALWAAFMYCYLALFKESRGAPGRLLARVGEISYSLYLTHLIVVQIVLRLNLVLGWAGQDVVANALLTTLLIVLPLAVVLASLTYHIVEKPFLDLRRAYLVRSAAAPPGVPTDMAF